MVRLTAFLDRNDANQLRLASDFLNRLALLVQAREELVANLTGTRPAGPAKPIEDGKAGEA